jgi:hypothetical protein
MVIESYIFSWGMALDRIPQRKRIDLFLSLDIKTDNGVYTD